MKAVRVAQEVVKSERTKRSVDIVVNNLDVLSLSLTKRFRKSVSRLYKYTRLGGLIEI